MHAKRSTVHSASVLALQEVEGAVHQIQHDPDVVEGPQISPPGSTAKNTSAPSPPATPTTTASTAAATTPSPATGSSTTPCSANEPTPSDDDVNC